MESQVSSVELIERQQALVQTREALKAERVEVMLAGGTFEKSDEIASLDHDITVLDDVIRVAKDRDEAARQATLEAERVAAQEALERQLADGLDKYVAHIEEAEKHFDQFAAALADGLHTLNGLQGLPYQFGLGSDHGGIGSMQARDRIGERATRILAKHLAPLRLDGSLGPIQWPRTQPGDANWTAEERRSMGRAQEGILSFRETQRRIRGEA